MILTFKINKAMNILSCYFNSSKLNITTIQLFLALEFGFEKCPSHVRHSLPQVPFVSGPLFVCHHNPSRSSVQEHSCELTTLEDPLLAYYYFIISSKINLQRNIGTKHWHASLFLWKISHFQLKFQWILIIIVEKK